MKLLFTSITLLLGILLFAQNDFNEGVILKVNDREVSTEEFKKVFTKNASIISEEDKMTVDEYFELFKKYQLKLEAAYQLNLDEDEAFLKEFQKYYKQLADNYIANGEVTDEMIKDTYHRLVTEVRVSHILISVQPNATEKELKDAFEKAQSLKTKLENGADFETLAKANSNDPSAKVNGGDMGWFKAFKMVYPFEDAAYNLEVGAISDPVKTQFGYHIIQKTGERKSLGKIKVAHIMIRSQQNDTTQTPEQKINEIYKKIQAGEDFSDLAKQFSQDENTASKGGEMQAFELGSINSAKFEEAAFLLTQDGQISEPFQTRFGWHVMKRISIEPLPSFEEQSEDLRRKIKTTDRAKLLNNKIQENIESFYDVSVNNKAISYLVSIVDESILKNKWKLNEEEIIPEEVFLQVDETVFTWKDLAQYVEKQQRAARNTASSQTIIKELADNFVYANLVEYHKSKLPELDPEFAASVQEYKNGLLLYEVMQRKIWNPAKEDSLALEAYYNKNASKYMTEKSIEVEIASFNNKKEAKSFVKQIKGEIAFSELAKSSSEAVYQEKEVKTLNSPSIAKNIKLKTGVSDIYNLNGQFVVYHITEILPIRQLRLEEIKGKVISDYQDHLEKSWLQTLNNQYNITVNQSELTKLKQEFE